MIIRREQADAFRPGMVKSFEDRMVAHLREAFSDRVAALDDDAVRAEVCYGRSRAAQYGIETERDVARFIDLMFLVRRDFDTSPDTPWAHPILTDKTSSAENRLRRLKVKATSERSPSRRGAPAFVAGRS